MPDDAMIPFHHFYHDKRVLVTGHTGFKGSWLTLWLLQLGAKVAGFSAYLPSKPCNFEVLGLKQLIEHYHGDICDSNQLTRVFKDFRPQVVFHLAAQPIVRRSYEEPKLTFDTNLGGTVNILECLRQSESVQAAVLITSDKCYRNREWVWGYRENDELGGDDPYSASKGCAEMAIHSYAQAYFNRDDRMNVASARAGNVVGGGDWAEDRIVPDCIRAWSEGREVIIRHPNATRPWQHVLEPLSGYLWLGVKLGTKELRDIGAFNFGPKADVVQSVMNLIENLNKYWKNSQWVLKEEKSYKKESGLLTLCCDKALSKLHWRAILSFEETVDFTALWYGKFYENRGNNILEFSRSQIERYCLLARERGLAWAETR